MKRARTSGGSVTGGTGDIKPQIFTVNSGLAGAVDDYTIFQHILPVPRFGTMKTKATVMELLKVDWYLSPATLSDTQITTWGFLTTSTNRVSGETALITDLRDDLNDPKVFALAVHSTTITTSGLTSITMPISIDLTDNNGNGMLIATDRIVVVQAGINQAAVGDCIAKILYRLVNVGITEYVGIVQSQQ